MYLYYTCCVHVCVVCSVKLQTCQTDIKEQAVTKSHCCVASRCLCQRQKAATNYYFDCELMSDDYFLYSSNSNFV